MTTAASTEFLISTLRGFKAPASDAGRILDVVNKVSNHAGTSVEMLADSFKILSPMAAELGISYEELASTMAPMIEVTRSGSEAANAMKTVYSNLIKPTKEVRDMLEGELGIQLEVNGQRRLASDILKEVRQKTEDMTAADRLSVAAKIAGAEQASRFTSYSEQAQEAQSFTPWRWKPMALHRKSMKREWSQPRLPSTE
jgi:TP901 family phage tail tape measure protein